ncbi:MAG: thermonuclease family protein [Smithellaceae bacterium]
MNKKTVPFQAFILLLFITGPTALLHISCSQSITYVVDGTVTHVSDGDTIHLITPAETKLTIRLYGIDAPEIDRSDAQGGKTGQPYGDASQKALADKIRGQQIQLGVIEMDKHHRLVGIIWMGNRNINLEMLQEGHAEAFVEYLKPPYRLKFLQAEREAKSAKRGIWSLPDYERPIDFRKRLNIKDKEG